MRFLDQEEVKILISKTLGADGRPSVPGPAQQGKRVAFEADPGYSYYARAKEVLEALGYFDWCVLWVVLTEVWPSNENLHLYYRLRQAYGDLEYVDRKPALMALRHESADLLSFLHLGMLFGWEMYLVTSHDEGRAFVSHDGWFEVSTQALDGATPGPQNENSGPAT